MIDFINSKIMTTVNYVMMILHDVNYVTIVYTHSKMAPRDKYPRKILFLIKKNRINMKYFQLVFYSLIYVWQLFEGTLKNLQNALNF